MRGVLFDLDGTLVDTNYLHALAWWRAFRELDVIVPVARVHRLIGMGSDRLIPEILGHDDERADELHGERFAELRGEARALPGARDLLRATKTCGLMVLLATSAKPDDAEYLVALLDADEWVDAVTTSDDVVASKPAPDIFAAALDRRGLEPADAVAVGDTGWDIEASRKLGTSCVALRSGGWSSHELREAGAVGVYEHPADLVVDFDRSALGDLARR